MDDSIFKDIKVTTDFSKIFSNDKTYYIPFPKKVEFSFDAPMLNLGKRVTAKSLNVNIPGIEWITIGGCGGEGNHADSPIFSPFTTQLAHTHVCPHDKLRNMICTGEDWWLFNPDGTYSNLLLHEVAHVITKYGFEVTDCGLTLEDHKFKIPKTLSDGEKDWTHGTLWKESALRLGISPTKYGQLPERRREPEIKPINLTDILSPVYGDYMGASSNG